MITAQEARTLREDSLEQDMEKVYSKIQMAAKSRTWIYTHVHNENVAQIISTLRSNGYDAKVIEPISNAIHVDWSKEL